jgi:hypothetical protein
MNKPVEQKIEIVHKGNLNFEEQIKKIEKMNSIFVDIATDFHVNKIKNEKET